VGQGETFWQFRRYEWGDSTQRIDWRQSAKSQPVYIRETEWEAAQSVWLWRDASPSMDYASASSFPSKCARAELLLLALAVLLVRGGERVAVLGTGHRPTSGRAVLNRIAGEIEEGRPATGSLPAIEPLPRYGRVVLIGDFLSPLEDVKATVAGFEGLGVRGHMVQVLDPAEETLPFSGRVRFDGMEDEGDMLISRVESIARDYQDLVAAHNGGLAQLARSAGWSFVTYRTDRPPESALLALYLMLAQPAGR
jgi:uncharacterized protein (DUF58 family)